ncbi:cytochrome aa3 quinol oxidase subunit II [Bacillus testis]|uniref:cytochrome aa3 quinol oxidase subunit II n=1 Tax=Bacillus testis TaxID=1622072 RepID=UPI00067F4886|nr:cytochrome aa3 quinol oxidase subunit II [Bacillus testis]
MKKKWAVLIGSFLTMLALAGCDYQRPLVFRPNGPVAQTQANTINFSVFFMIFILVVVVVLYIFMLTKYRASKAPKDYEPPHDKGNKYLEFTWTIIPIIIVTILAVVTVKTTNEVEKTPKGYEDQKPLVIYAASSNWKWHFSYPEEGIETVNYVNMPTKRPVEFRIYSYGPITSLWIPQLGGQKYGMSDMITKLHFVADNPKSMMGRNSNFSGQGTAKMEFEALSMTPADFDQWVKDVKANEKKLTEKEFNKLLDTPYVGRKSYSSTHLKFSPPPEEHEDMQNMKNMDDMDMKKTTPTDGSGSDDNQFDKKNTEGNDKSEHNDHSEHSNH